MQYELKKCLDQTDRKNDRKDDKNRWELIPLDCLDDIARVYTEGAKKYDDNTWKQLENGYERYKGALLRHLCAAETETFDEDTGCRHLAQVAWNAIALLWISKHTQDGDILTPEQIAKRKQTQDFYTVLNNWEDIINADCKANASKKVSAYEYDDKNINRAIKRSGLKDVKISYSPILNWSEKTEDAKERDGRFIYSLSASAPSLGEGSFTVLEYNLLKKDLINFLNSFKINTLIKHKNGKNGLRETRPNTDESGSNTTILEEDSKGCE